jgi:uncharacterized protein (TIGR01619 family)
MGLFDKLFKKKPAELTAETGYNEEWDFYFSNVDDKFSSIAVDLGLNKIAPIDKQTNLVWISITMNNPRPDGLSSNEESGILGEIEDALDTELKNKFEATYCGRLTSNNFRDLYFFLEDSTLYDKAISDIMVAYPNYSYDYGIKDDPNWTGYFDFLYPLPNQMQSIQNRRVVDNLESNGDKLTKKRPVFHWLYFRTDEDREMLLKKIESENFEIINKSFDDSFGEYGYGLQLSRVDNVDLNSVDEYVLQLWQLAGECNGEYDGWETSIEKE